MSSAMVSSGRVSRTWGPDGFHFSLRSRTWSCEGPFLRPGWGARGGGGCAGCLWARERYAMCALLCFLTSKASSGMENLEHLEHVYGIFAF